MARVFNFSAGPAALPQAVLQQAADEMLDWQGTGMSVMEMSHRGKAFMSIAAQAEADLRDLLQVPTDYHVLFMQGGALAENAILPMNLMNGRAADYVITGQWSSKSAKEARRYGEVRIAADTTGSFTRIPPLSEWRLSSDAAYVHVCTNETIDGVEFHWLPDTGSVPLVADVSSHILSRPFDIARYGCLYGGAQKNIGPSGLTLVIVHRDLVGKAHALCPTAFNYQVVAENASMYNTPPTYAMYVAGLVFRWIKAQGGLAAMEQLNHAKATLLYQTIDASGFYSNPVVPSDRSRMNVPFFLRDPTLDSAFLQGAEARGLVQLKGHRSVGGMRASIYNAMPLEGVQALVDYMQDFEQAHG